MHMERINMPGYELEFYERKPSSSTDVVACGLINFSLTVQKHFFDRNCPS